MFKSRRRDKTNVGDEVPVSTSSTHKKGLVSHSHARRRWRKLSVTKKLAILATPLVVLVAIGFVISQVVMNNKEQPDPSPNLVTEEKVDLAALVAKPPTESMSVDEKIAYYDKLTLGYGQQGKYDKAVESFSTREGISTQGLKFDDYLNLAQYQFGAGHKEAAPAALDKAEAALKSDPNMTEQDKAELLKHLTKLREGYTQQ